MSDEEYEQLSRQIDDFCQHDCDLHFECNTRIDCPYRGSEESLLLWLEEYGCYEE